MHHQQTNKNGNTMKTYGLKKAGAYQAIFFPWKTQRKQTASGRDNFLFLLEEKE
jgi:hypothetical protein